MGPGNRNLDLEWLEDFIALAESGNFSRAAEVRAIASAFAPRPPGVPAAVPSVAVGKGAHNLAATAWGGDNFGTNQRTRQSPRFSLSSAIFIFLH